MPLLNSNVSAPNVYGPENEDLPDIFPEPTSPDLSQERKDQLKTKVSVGLSTSNIPNITADSARSMVDSGRTDELRDVMARGEDVKNVQAQAGYVESVVKSNKPLTADEIRQIQYRPPATDPRTIIEKKFAQSVIDNTLTSDVDTYRRAKEVDQQTIDLIVDKSEKALAKNAILDSIIADTEAKYAAQSSIGAATDFVKGFIPGYIEWKRYRSTGTIFGDAFQKERERLFSIDDPAQFKAQAENIIGFLAQDNPQLALEMAHSFKQFGAQDALIHNILTGVDLAFVAQTAAGVAKGSSKFLSRLRAADTVRPPIVPDAPAGLPSPEGRLALPAPDGKPAIAGPPDVPMITEMPKGFNEKNPVWDLPEAYRPRNPYGTIDENFPGDHPIWDLPSSKHPKQDARPGDTFAPNNPIYDLPSEYHPRNPSASLEQNYPKGHPIWDLPQDRWPRSSKTGSEFPERDPIWDMPSSTHPEAGGVHNLPNNMDLPEHSTVWDLPTDKHPVGQVKDGGKASISPSADSEVARTIDTLSDVVSTASKENASVRDVVAATGRIEDAVAVSMAEGSGTRLRVLQSGEDALKYVSWWADKNLSGIANPFVRMIDSPYELAKEYGRRLSGLMEDQKVLGLRALFDTNLVSRIDRTAAYQGAALDQAKEAVKNLYGKNTVNSILSQKYIPGSQSGTNVDHVLTYLGRPDGTLFRTPQEAAGFAKTLGLNGEDLLIVKQGGNFALMHNRIIDETVEAMRPYILYSNTTNPETITNMFVGKFLSADANLSKGATQVRAVATNVQSEWERLLGEFAKPIGKLGKEEKTRLFALMDDLAARISHNSNGNPSRGYFCKTVSDFQNEYMTKFRELPSRKEIDAYFTAVHVNDLDYVIRSIDIFKNKAQRGIGNIEFNYKDVNTSSVVRTEPAYGKLVDKLPSFEGKEDFRVGIVDNSGNVRVINSRTASAADRKYIKDVMEHNNHRLAQIEEPEMMQHKSVFGGSEPVEFIIAPDIKQSNIDISKMLPYNEGGHAIENMNWRVKFPKTGKTSMGDSYFGDMTFSGHTREFEARKMAEDLDAVRKVYKQAIDSAGHGPPNLNPVIQEIANRQLPFGIKDFLDDVNKGFISKDHAPAVVRDGQKYTDVVDIKAAGLYNYRNSPHRIEAGQSTAFTGERGAGSYSFETGGANNPAWMPVKARMLDTGRAMNKSMEQLVSSHIYSDLQIRTAREFVEQFGGALVGNREAWRQNPLYALMHPEWNERVDKVHLAAAKKFQQAAMQLIYSPSELSKEVTAAKEAFLNWGYSKGYKGAMDWLEDSAIYKTRDPTRFLRGFAFHTTMGLFNPVHLVLNMQTLFHMTAISPLHAPGAVKDSVIMRMAMNTLDPQMIAKLGKISGYQHFGEMYSEMVRSGINDISGSIAHLDDALQPKVVTTGLGRFLDTATMFFSESEAGLRRTAWGVSYREWRAANPKAVVDDMARQEILQRANVLNVKMSRESQAMFQKGVWSIPFQFTSYSLRMAEQIMSGVLGKGQLSRAEAARVLGMNSLLYGLPTAAGAAVGVIPLNEIFRKYAINNNVDIDANAMTTILTQGLLAAAAHWGGAEKYNISERWGPGNSSIVSDIASGNKSLGEIAMGPAGSMAWNAIKSGSPLVHYMGSMFSNDPSSRYPLVPSDALDVARNIQTVNNLTRAYLAYQHGLWINKNGVIQSQASSSESFFAAILGLSPRDAADVYPMQEILKNHSEIKKDLQTEIQREANAAFLANIDGDTELFDAHMKRATYLIQNSGFTPEEKSTLFENMAKVHDLKNTELKVKILRNKTGQDAIDFQNQMITDKQRKEQR